MGNYLVYVHIRLPKSSYNVVFFRYIIVNTLHKDVTIIIIIIVINLGLLPF